LVAAIARSSGGGARVEEMPVAVIAWGFPAFASLVALAALQRLRPGRA